MVDDEVAAEKELAEAIRRRQEADELYRRSMESAAVGMCLASPQGPLIEVNQAMCKFFGYDAETLLTKTWIELTAPEYIDADLANVTEMVAGRIESYEMDKQFIHADGHRIWGHLAVGCLRAEDGSVAMSIGQIVDITGAVEARQKLDTTVRRLAASENNYRLLAENASDVVIHGRDGRVIWASPAIEQLLGAPAAYWAGRHMREFIPPGERFDFGVRIAKLEAGETIQRRSRVIAVDGIIHWVHVHAVPYYDADGKQSGFISALRQIDAEVEAEKAAADARWQQIRADQLYRRSMESAAVGMCLTEPAGRFTEVNDALCRFFGYDADTLKQMTWQQLTAPGYLDSDLTRVDEMLAGRRDTYRTLKQFIHADGRLVWGDLSVGCTRDSRGGVEKFIAQIVDVTDSVEISERNAVLNQRIAEELESAADYMASIMPGDLSGAVGVSSRYLPSRELGGDCFDYSWIDDEHLVIYLIDVSGHGIEPALLAVSLQNMLRSGSFPTEVLLDPAVLLTELNRMFQMELQREHFFTMWYGVYETTTRTLRYASAGAPPALVFSGAPENRLTATPLAATSAPVGVLGDTAFRTDTCSVAPGSRILVYSDGASEIPLGGGELMSQNDFEKLATRLCRSPGWTLDDLVGELLSLTQRGVFEDDVSLIRLAFD